MHSNSWLRGRAGAPLGRELSHKSERGFTLVELMIAALLLLMATAGILPFYVAGLSHSSAIRYKSLATNVAREYMEMIRELDYREITMNEAEGETLAQRFETAEGTEQVTVAVRNISFDVTFAVEPSTYDSTLKKVTVSASWTGPPRPSPVELTSMIHQQYLGARGSLLEVLTATLQPAGQDVLGTPFPLVGPNYNLRYHLASVDWGLVFADVNNPSGTKTDAYARVVFVDDYGQVIQFGDPADSFKIDSDFLVAVPSTGPLSDVYYQMDLTKAHGLPFWDDEDGLPDAHGNMDGYYDGYWEIHATNYNQYDQPGNTWRTRVRIENGRPNAPKDLVVVQSDKAEAELYWLPSSERDRKGYVLERYTKMIVTDPVSSGITETDSTETWDPETGTWTSTGWTASDPGKLLLPATATSFIDRAFPDPLLYPDTKWQYQYCLYAVDTYDESTNGAVDPALPGKPALTAVIEIPPLSTSPGYRLYTSADNGMVQRVDSLEAYPAGTSVKLTAIPNDGYEFSKWTGDVTGSANPATITMDSSKFITAVFTQTGLPPASQVTIENDTGTKYLVTVKDSSSNIIKITTLDSYEKCTLTDLASGSYAIFAKKYTATKTLSGSFTVPDLDRKVVLSLLK